jgi:hypothetical protein
MKPLLMALSAAAIAAPVAMATPAAAQSWEYRQELRECNRELRRAETRREYQRELRECRRELRRAQRYGSSAYYGQRYYDPYGSRYYDGYRYYDRYDYGYYPRSRSGVYFGIGF